MGTFLILRRQSLMSDTLSHVSLSGVAFGLVLGISPTISTIAIVLIAAVFLEYLRTVYKSFMEIGTAILMSTGLAVSLIVMSKGKSSSFYEFGPVPFWFNRDYQRRAGYFPFCHCGGCLDFWPSSSFVLCISWPLMRIRPLWMVCQFVPCLFFLTWWQGVAIALMIPAARSSFGIDHYGRYQLGIALRLGKNFKSVMLLASAIGFLGMVAGLYISYYAENTCKCKYYHYFCNCLLLISLVRRFIK